LTTARIAALAPRPAPYDARDAELTGLVVRVHPSGRKVFNCRYRLRDGRQKTVKLGPASIGVAAARRIALGLLAEVAAGGDPATERHTARTAARTAAAHTEARRELASQRRLGVYLAGPYARHVEAEQKRGHETVMRIKSAFASFLGLELTEITEQLVRDWRAERLKGGIAPSTADREVSMLSTLLGHAMRVSRLLAANPLRELRPLVRASAKTNTVRFLDDAEELRLRQALHDRDGEMREKRARLNAWRAARSKPALPDYPEHFVDHLEPIVLVLLNTGLRFGELTQLRWEAIDFRTRLVAVAGSTTKSGVSRHVPMTGEVASVVSRWRTQYPPGDRVFPGRSGQTLTDIKTAWASLLQRAGIARLRIHDLRHSFASRLVQRGVDLYRVQRLLGHASPVMTQRYAHLQPDFLIDAVSVLDRGCATG
jgi:integrase